MATTAHGTLEPNVVATVVVESGRGGIVIVNRQQSGVIWVRLDGVDPVAEGAGTFAVFGARDFGVQVRSGQVKAFEVRMLSDVAVQYSVEAY